MTDLFGPVPVRANLSARQARALGLMTSGTCGRTSIGSSASASLQSSLENRLQARTQTLGSTLYKLTWKPWLMPSGLSRSRLRASVLRTSEIARTGWPTPTAALAEKGVRTFEGGLMEAMSNHGPDLAAAACLAGWPTPTANAKDQVETRRGLQTLGGSALLSGWPSPTACDSNRKPSQDFKTPNITVNHAAMLSGWPTPSAGTPQSLRGNGQDPEARRSQGHQVNLKDAVRYLMHDHPARLTACGQMLTGSSAGMEGGGQLSPEHPRWLMGLPAEWDACAPTETPSMLKRRRTS
jgi:hypothetical protein